MAVLHENSISLQNQPREAQYAAMRIILLSALLMAIFAISTLL
jgi:hypothetical protein